MDYSLRAYLSRLYLIPALQITICNRKVEAVKMLKELKNKKVYQVTLIATITMVCLRGSILPCGV